LINATLYSFSNRLRLKRETADRQKPG
jgi:hypothetical protein